MFTSPCFIRQNTSELRKKLEDIGYITLNNGNTTLDAHNYDGRGNHKTIDEGNIIITGGNSYGVCYELDSVTKMDRIDCGTNEKLFLAIAALRDNNDKDQWFVANNNDKCFVQCRHSAFCCNSMILGENYEIIGMQDDTAKFHKATVKELMNHFKNI